jgi:hypothetical protein
LRRALIILLLLVSASAYSQLATDVDTLLFRTVKIGFSRDAVLRVENPSSNTVTIQSVSIQPLTANPGDFSVVTPTQTTFDLVPGEFRNFILRFTPKTPGKNTAMLRIETLSGITEVFLYGDISSTQPDIFVIPSFIDFGPVALGEVKDTSFLITGGGIDSINIIDLMLENDDGNIYFEAFPLNGSFSFPRKIGPFDTIAIHARFSALSPVGMKTGRCKTIGQVSGVLECGFRAEVAYPEMRFTPDTIDIGLLTIGDVKDTSVYVESIGKASVLVEDIIPPLYFQLLTTPTIPQSLEPGSSVRLDLRYRATAIGSVNDVVGALAKSTGSGGKYRQALLRGLVLPAGLVSSPDSVLRYECGKNMIDSLTVTVMDTGMFPFTVESLHIDNPNFIISSAVTLPLNLDPQESQTLTVVYTPDNTIRQRDSAIIEFKYNGFVMLRETVWVQFEMSSLPLTASRISGSPNDYTDTLNLSAGVTLDTKSIFDVEYVIRVVPTDIVDIDTNLLNTILVSSGNVAGSIHYDELLQAYRLRISSLSPLTVADITSVKVPIRYYVSKDNKGIFEMAVGVPGSEQCYAVYYDTVSFSSPQICGDPHIRQALNTTLTANFIGSQVLTSDNDFVISYELNTSAYGNLDIYSLTGIHLGSYPFSSRSQGQYDVPITRFESGSVVANLTTIVDGKKSAISRVYQFVK